MCLSSPWGVEVLSVFEVVLLGGGADVMLELSGGDVGGMLRSEDGGIAEGGELVGGGAGVMGTVVVGVFAAADAAAAALALALVVVNVEVAGVVVVGRRGGGGEWVTVGG
jgi:hypothetical protein